MATLAMTLVATVLTPAIRGVVGVWMGRSAGVELRSGRRWSAQTMLSFVSCCSGAVRGQLVHRHRRAVVFARVVTIKLIADGSGRVPDDGGAATAAVSAGNRSAGSCRWYCNSLVLATNQMIDAKL
jgi:hypothetical protein